MSTRSTTHFVDGPNMDPTAIIYRHSDGYPTGHGADLLAFFVEVAESIQDTRFNDTSYLASKLVVWLAKRYAYHYDFMGDTPKRIEDHYLDFLSVGIVDEDPGDIQYRYVVDCSRFVYGRPHVTIIRLGFGARPDETLGEVADVVARESAEKAAV